LSIFTNRSAVVALPALSTAVPFACWDKPSLVNDTAVGHTETPERTSEHANVTITSVLFQPAALGAGDCDGTTTGGVLSILRDPFVEAVLSAMSFAVPGMGWLAPSVVTVTGIGQSTIPDRLSIQSKDTVTSVLFHPFAFARGACRAVIVGTDLSRLTVKVVEAELPAWSLTIPETLWPLTSVVTETGDEHESKGETLGVHEKLTVTF
jgi:hypothetical protein